MELVLRETKVVTQSFAKHVAQMHGLADERPIREQRIAWLRSQVAQGIVLPWLWSFCVVDGQEYRINGQHSSRMLAELAPEAFPAGTVAFIAKWKCDSMDEAARIYAGYDSRGSARSCPQIYSVMMHADPAFADVNEKTFAASVVGIAYAEHGEDAATSVPLAERCEGALRQPEFVHFLQRLLDSNPEAAGLVRRGPPVAAMYLGWNKAHQKCEEFWTMVCNGTAPEPNHPSRKLQFYLRGVSVCKGAGSKQGKRMDSPVEMIAKCVQAWNAFRRGESLSLLKCVGGKVPTAL